MYPYDDGEVQYPSPPDGGTLAQSIRDLYMQYFHRTPSEAEVQSMAGNPGGIEGVRQTILQSPEYQQLYNQDYATKTAQQTPPIVPPGSGPAPTLTTPPPSGPHPMGGDARTVNLGGQPTPDLPTYTPPPAYTPPPKFSYADFNDPDPTELQNDPQYQYTLKTQQDAIQRSAAARGVLNTGGTINDLLTNANDIASQGYHDLYNRKFQDYTTNRGNALESYLTNYNIDRNTYNDNYTTQYKDPFAANYQRGTDLYNAQQHNYDQGLYYQNHASDQNRQYNWYSTLFDYQRQSDDWDRRYRLLGLI